MSNHIRVNVKGTNKAYNFKNGESLDFVTNQMQGMYRDKLSNEMAFASQGPKPADSPFANYMGDVFSGKLAKDELQRYASLVDRVSKGDQQAGRELFDEFGFSGMTAFHGSPHKFEKFKMSKIGTGEGAQAYGHGLYFAENPKVAGSYKEAGATLTPRARMAYDDADGDWAKAAKIAKGKSDTDPSWSGISEELSSVKQGSLYEVDIPDKHIAKMLDWDKPLSEQADSVKTAIKSVVEDAGGDYNKVISTKWKGGDFYKQWLGEYGDEAMTETLKAKGVAGIKYKDAMSRGAEEGTRNFVVFDEDIVKILERK